MLIAAAVAVHFGLMRPAHARQPLGWAGRL